MLEPGARSTSAGTVIGLIHFAMTLSFVDENDFGRRDLVGSLGGHIARSNEPSIRLPIHLLPLGPSSRRNWKAMGQGSQRYRIFSFLCRRL